MDQHAEVMLALGRIEQKIDGHVTEDQRVHKKQDAAIGTLYIKANTNEKSLARIKGWGSGVAAFGGLLITLLGLDQFGG